MKKKVPELLVLLKDHTEIITIIVMGGKSRKTAIVGALLKLGGAASHLRCKTIISLH